MKLFQQFYRSYWFRPSNFLGLFQLSFLWQSMLHYHSLVVAGLGILLHSAMVTRGVCHHLEICSWSLLIAVWLKLRWSWTIEEEKNICEILWFILSIKKNHLINAKSVTVYLLTDVSHLMSFLIVTQISLMTVPFLFPSTNCQDSFSEECTRCLLMSFYLGEIFLLTTSICGMPPGFWSCGISQRALGLNASPSHCTASLLGR